MTEKICNQVMSTKSPTMLCEACKEESFINQNFPYPLEQFVKGLEAFMDLHTAKGCNKYKIDKRE